MNAPSIIRFFISFKFSLGHHHHHNHQSANNPVVQYLAHPRSGLARRQSGMVAVFIAQMQ
jgi:hypothetical protein